MHEIKVDGALREGKTCVQQDLPRNEAASKETQRSSQKETEMASALPTAR